MTTKLALEQINAKLAAENAELRAQLSVLTANLSALQTTHAASKRPYVAPETKEHEYADFAEAKANLLRLKAELPQFRFTQVGCKVLCRLPA